MRDLFLELIDTLDDIAETISPTDTRELSIEELPVETPTIKKIGRKK